MRDENYFKRLRKKIVLEYLETKWIWEEYFDASLKKVRKTSSGDDKQK
jgi:hypothetical protein